ncbi:MAG: 2-oxoacid:acceptor oxidoreductase family protein [Desulfobacter sp.]|nr:2-oxoacid:acceptor oxidoreductase family protein [Desulfobacter sp.]WDP83816.1 MAG: 2-oxoacid:acceptor oxidoreductase family protein [Desulfobacter sp.]
MNQFNIHITGVGGQGIGLLSQALLRGIDHAGIPVIAVDTHGLAQRGGVVVSRIRCGVRVHSPMTMKHSADLVLGMEVHEAMRGLCLAIKKGGTLVYMNVSWQPLPVRLGQSAEITADQIKIACDAVGIKRLGVDFSGMGDPRMQNMALLGTVARYTLVADVDESHYVQALKDLLPDHLLDSNLALFKTFARGEE